MLVGNLSGFGLGATGILPVRSGYTVCLQSQVAGGLALQAACGSGGSHAFLVVRTGGTPVAPGLRLVWPSMVAVFKWGATGILPVRSGYTACLLLQAAGGLAFQAACEPGGRHAVGHFALAARQWHSIPEKVKKPSNLLALKEWRH